MPHIEIKEEMLKASEPRIMVRGETTDETINFYGWGEPLNRLKFVAVRGEVEDWCIYVESMAVEQTYDEVKTVGNKVGPAIARLLVSTSEEIWGAYRT